MRERGGSAAALGGALRLDRLRFGVGVWVAGWWCGACAGGGTGLGSVTRRAMRARRRAAAVGSWLVVCAASTRPLLRLPVLLGDFSGAGLSCEGPGGCEAGCAGCCEDATRGCGWGSAGRAVLADGWRMRGADRRTGSGTRRVCARAAARQGVARVRGLRLARGLREIRLVWVEVCGFVGMAAVVGSGSQRREREGRRPLGRSAAAGSAGVWVWVRSAGCQWWWGACACGGTGLGSVTWRAMRVRQRAAAVGSWLVMCAAGSRPLSDFLFCWAISRGRACLVRGRGRARRDAPWLL
jgi:hypothetical protein